MRMRPAGSPPSTSEKALGTGDLGLLRRYPRHPRRRYGLYYQTARVFVKLIGTPRSCARWPHGLRNKTLMDPTLKVMANLLDKDDTRMGERVYDSLAGWCGRSPPVERHRRDPASTTVFPGDVDRRGDAALEIVGSPRS